MQLMPVLIYVYIINMFYLVQAIGRGGVYTNIHWVSRGFQISVHMGRGERTQPTELYLTNFLIVNI